MALRQPTKNVARMIRNAIIPDATSFPAIVRAKFLNVTFLGADDAAVSVDRIIVMSQSTAYVYYEDE